MLIIIILQGLASVLLPGMLTDFLLQCNEILEIQLMGAHLRQLLLENFNSGH